MPSVDVRIFLERILWRPSYPSIVTDFTSYLLGLLSGLLVALVSYWLALRFPPKQRLHECYGNLLPLVEEAVLLLGMLESLRKVDVKDPKKFWETYVCICEPLVAIHDTETMREIANLITVDPSSMKEKDVVESLTFIRLIAQRSVSAEIAKTSRGIYRYAISLSLLNPSKEVSTHLDRIRNAILTRLFEVSRTSVEDVAGAVDLSGVHARIETQQLLYTKVFGSDLSIMLNGLASAMRKDLDRKL